MEKDILGPKMDKRLDIPSVYLQKAPAQAGTYVKDREASNPRETNGDLELYTPAHCPGVLLYPCDPLKNRS